MLSTKLTAIIKELHLRTVQPAYQGSARDRIFSIVGRFRLIEVPEETLKILPAVNVFR